MPTFVCHQNSILLYNEILILDCTDLIIIVCFGNEGFPLFEGARGSHYNFLVNFEDLNSSYYLSSPYPNPQLMNFNLIISAFLLLFYPITSYCQFGPKLLSGGIKITGNPDSKRTFEGFDVSYYTENFVFTGGYYVGETLGLTILGSFNGRTFHEANLLVGKYKIVNKFCFKYQGGLGYLWGTMRADSLISPYSSKRTYYQKTFNSISVPIVFGMRYIPFKFMSIGIDMHVNVNFSEHFFRPMLCFEFGKLR